MIRLALYQPEIPQNTGTLLRLSACLGVGVDIIEPCGFALSDARLKRAGMDYLNHTHIQRHASFEDFENNENKLGRRLVLLTPQTPKIYTAFDFQATDTLVLGRESDGVPSAIQEKMIHQIKIPMIPQLRSLNLAIAAAIVLGEALRQTSLFPQTEEDLF